ncbi:MAG: hypothetical protein ACKVUT_15900 [Gaiella sp.]
MTATASSHAPTRTGVASRITSTWVALLSIVVGGAVARLVLVSGRTTPHYYPDEYLYPEVARSLWEGHGTTVLGQPSGISALLEPLLTAPIWGAFESARAVELTQGLHAVWIGLAAIPVFALCRTLKLSDRAALYCSAATVLGPGAFYTGFLTSDALGYFLGLATMALGVRLVALPTRSTEVLFLLASGLTSFARLQYVILVPAVFLAGLVVERGRVRVLVRRFPFLTGMLALGGVAMAIGGSGALGRYQAIATFGVSREAGTWFASGLLLLAIGAGVAIVPGAVAWAIDALHKHKAREQTAFAALLVLVAGGLLTVASIYAVETSSDRFLERYLVIVAPLLSVAFACWLSAARPCRRVAIISAVTLVAAAALVPLSSYTGGQGVADSPTLFGYLFFERHLGVGDASLLTAAAVSLAALLALAAAVLPRVSGLTVGGLALTLMTVLAIAAHATERDVDETARAVTFAGAPDWIDAEGGGPALLIMGDGGNPLDAMATAVMNRSIEAAAPLGDSATKLVDGFGVPVTISPTGVLIRNGRPLVHPVVFSIEGGAAGFSGAEKVVYDQRFVLAIPLHEARLSMYAFGVKGNGRLAATGSFGVYPQADGACTSLSLHLTLPPGVPPSVVELIEAGTPRRRIRISPAAPADLRITSPIGRSRIVRYRTVTLGDRSVRSSDRSVADVRYTSRRAICAPKTDIHKGSSPRPLLPIQTR